MREVPAILRLGVLALSASAITALVSTVVGPAGPTHAALQQEGKGAQVLIGKDDDNLTNPLIQPPEVAANQSLNNADVLDGGPGNDVLIGLLGSDVLLGGPGLDILVGGTEQGSQPNSDVMFGGPGRDVSIWAGGDGSDAFIGGPDVDALVFWHDRPHRERADALEPDDGVPPGRTNCKCQRAGRVLHARVGH